MAWPRNNAPRPGGFDGRGKDSGDDGAGPIRQHPGGAGGLMAKRLVVLGAGGHGHAVNALLRDLGGPELVGLVGAAPGAVVCRVPARML
jgi:hypothetical protein